MGPFTYEALAILRPTSPLRSSDDIESMEAFSILSTLTQ